MKKFIQKNLFKLIIVFCTIIIIILPLNVDAYVNVKGYYRKDGTYIKPHIRSNPNSLKYDNYNWTPNQGLYNKTYNTRGTNWDTPTWITDPDYYEGKNLYENKGYTPSYPSYTAPTIPSCPLNSYYNSISKNCKCNYGYVVGKDFLGKESCVSGNSYCHDKYGYNSSYNSLNKSCKCNYGYLMSEGKCISEDKYCENLYGWHAKYNSLYSKCECDYGYKLANGKCEKKQKKIYVNDYTSNFSNLTDNKICGNNSYLTNNNKCTCKSGYVWIDKNDNKNLDCKKKDICKEGYIKINGKCITYSDNCKRGYGDNVYGDKNYCYCNNGYKWNDDKTECIQVNIKFKNKNKSEIIKEEKSLVTKIDKNLSKKMSGNILLQIEKNGEGWYVHPDDKKKYYLGRPSDAFNVIRKLGLGIKHSELKNYLNSKFPSRLCGKIMLDIEQNGEAYYVNPSDFKGYYLNRPLDAFNVMRKLGLGITNSDVRKIDVGEIK